MPLNATSPVPMPSTAIAAEAAADQRDEMGGPGGVPEPSTLDARPPAVEGAPVVRVTADAT
ncbi:MAG: hypothetical protein ABIR77_01275, partial [Sphingomicrobium sp.]